MTSLKLKMRAPPAGEQPSEVSVMNTMGTPHSPMRFYTDRDGDTVLEMDELGSFGDATVAFKLALLKVPKSTTRMSLDAEYELEETKFLGGSYTVRGSTAAPLPDATVN